MGEAGNHDIWEGRRLLLSLLAKIECSIGEGGGLEASFEIVFKVMGSLSNYRIVSFYFFSGKSETSRPDVSFSNLGNF